MFVAVLAAACLAACGAAEGREQTAGPTDRCGPVETVPIQGGAHLLADQDPPVPYTTVPPTSGWHRGGAITIGVHGTGDALAEPAQVSVLEAGAVVATYRGLSDQDRAALETAAQVDHPGRVAVTPYDRLSDDGVTFAAWGVLQRCSALDLDALDAFVTSYAVPEPETGH